VRALWRSCEGRGPRAPTPHPRSVLAAPRAPPRVRVPPTLAPDTGPRHWPPTLACQTNRHLWRHHGASAYPGLSPNWLCVLKGAVLRIDRVFSEREAAYPNKDMYFWALTEIGELPSSGLYYILKYARLLLRAECPMPCSPEISWSPGLLLRGTIPYTPLDRRLPRVSQPRATSPRDAAGSSCLCLGILQIEWFLWPNCPLN
jgi:hypothetical protein